MWVNGLGITPLGSFFCAYVPDGVAASSGLQENAPILLVPGSGFTDARKRS